MFVRHALLTKNKNRMSSFESKMDPGLLPVESRYLSTVEQQLISRLAPIMRMYKLKHGGSSSKGLYVTFPQEVNEPFLILPKLAKDISILSVRKQEVNNHTKDFNVQRVNVQQALLRLKNKK